MMESVFYAAAYTLGTIALMVVSVALIVAAMVIIRLAWTIHLQHLER